MYSKIFLLASMKTLTNRQDCSKSPIIRSVPDSLSVIGFYSVYPSLNAGKIYVNGHVLGGYFRTIHCKKLLVFSRPQLGCYWIIPCQGEFGQRHPRLGTGKQQTFFLQCRQLISLEQLKSLQLNITTMRSSTQNYPFCDTIPLRITDLQKLLGPSL